MADVITRLKVESNEYDSKIKRAAQGLLQMEEACRKVGGTLAILEKDEKEYVAGLGSMETVSKSARGRLNELTQAYTELSIQYKRLTDEEKKGDFGKALSSSLGQLKGRITDAKQQLAEVDKELGDASKSGIDFNSVLTSLGQRFGINSELMSVMTSGTLASTAAVTAGAAAVAYAAKQWADYNDQLTRQQSMTTTITGLKGGDAEDLTIGARALAKTYDVDFRQAIEAANTLIQQFGVSGEEALSLLQDGMQGMIQGDGGKLLSMIQQYAPSFRDAGVEASQLVAVIQNSEGGLFTDQNMNAIVMGIRNIRLMTKQTSEALAQLGIDGEDMSKKLEDGSMTIFEALKQVAGKIDDVGSGSKAAGEVMQSVFGRQGTMAGTKLGEAIATLNTNLEETKTQTGEVGENLRKVNEKTEELERSLAEVFATAKWDEWASSLKVFALEGLTFTVDWIGKMKELNEQWNIYNIGVRKALAAIGVLDEKKSAGGGGIGGIGQGVKGGIQGVIDKASSKTPVYQFVVTKDKNGNVLSASRDGNDVTKEYLKTIADNTKPNGGGGGGGKTTVRKDGWSQIAMGELDGLDVSKLGRNVKDVKADISAAQKEYEEAGNVFGRMAALEMIEALQGELEGMKAMEDPIGDVNKDFKKSMKGLENSDEKGSKKENLKEVNLSKEVANVAGGIQQVVGGMEQLGIDIPDGLKGLLGGMQTVTTILTGIATTVLAIEAIAGADVLIPFKNGGIVPHAATGMLIPGNDFADRTPILASSGELILNRAQQGNLVAQMEGGNGGGWQGAPYVDGEKIWLGVNNFLKRSGKGEIVTGKR